MVKEFFNTVRPLFGGSMTQSQVVGCEKIIDGFESWGNRQVNTLAYILATAWWETAKTMRPIKETFRPSDGLGPDDDTVKRRLDAAWAKGQLKWVKSPYWREGWFGRGLVQLTHEFNYSGKVRDAVYAEFGVDIHDSRDLVMRWDIAVFILIKGIIHGWFTSKEVGDFLDDLDEDDAEDLREYLGARKTVNGTDRAKEIAEAAIVFERAIRRQEVADATPTAPEHPPGEDQKEDTYVPTTQLPWWVWPLIVIVLVLLALGVAAWAFFSSGG